MILEHGPLATPSDIQAGEGGEGLRVLRLWGGQLLAALECLASVSLVLRDLRASTVFVSPDGSTVKIVAFSSLATLASDGGGGVSPEAPDLDGDIHGPTKPLTPPEALTIWTGLGKGNVSDKDGSSLSSLEYGGQKGPSLVLADIERPGEFPTTPSWDVWTLGILLFELAFGHPPPAYGNCVRQGLSSLPSGTPTAASVPSMGELVTSIQYDFMSTVSGQAQGGTIAEEFATTDIGKSPLERALGCMSLGAAIGERDPFHVTQTTSDGRGAAVALSGIGGGDVRRSVERFRRAWVRRQLQMEESGDVNAMTWQAFQEKLMGHLDVSIAPPTVATVSPLARRELLTQGGGDEGGGKRRTNLAHPDDDSATMLSGARAARAEVAEAAVQRVAARLLAADPRETGRTSFSVVRGAMRDELQLSLSASEAELVATCLRDAGEPEGGRGRVLGDDREGPLRREGEGGVFYPPLVHVLRVLSLSAAGPALGSPRSARAEDGTSPPPTPTAFVELLYACLEPSPNRRLSSRSLLRLPFFSRGEARVENASDLQAASAYVRGSGNEVSPTLALHERVESRIQALEEAIISPSAASNEDNQQATVAGTRGSSVPLRLAHGRGVSDASTNFGAGALVEALKELERLVQQSSPAAHYLAEDDHPRQARRVARGHAKVVDGIFQSGVLMRASALALRFLDREEVRTVILWLSHLTLLLYCFVQFVHSRLAALDNTSG